MPYDVAEGNIITLNNTKYKLQEVRTAEGTYFEGKNDYQLPSIYLIPESEKEKYKHRGQYDFRKLVLARKEGQADTDLILNFQVANCSKIIPPAGIKMVCVIPTIMKKKIIGKVTCEGPITCANLKFINPNVAEAKVIPKKQVGTKRYGNEEKHDVELDKSKLFDKYFNGVCTRKDANWLKKIKNIKFKFCEIDQHFESDLQTSEIEAKALAGRIIFYSRLNKFRHDIIERMGDPISDDSLKTQMREFLNKICVTQRDHNVIFYPPKGLAPYYSDKDKNLEFIGEVFRLLTVGCAADSYSKTNNQDIKDDTLKAIKGEFGKIPQAVSEDHNATSAPAPSSSSSSSSSAGVVPTFAPVNCLWRPQPIFIPVRWPGFSATPALLPDVKNEKKALKRYRDGCHPIAKALDSTLAAVNATSSSSTSPTDPTPADLAQSAVPHQCAKLL